MTLYTGSSSAVASGIVLQDGATLSYALVCESAVVHAGATVEAGSIVCYNVVIGAKHTVPRNTRISLCRQIQNEVSTIQLCESVLVHVRAGMWAELVCG